MRREMMSSPLVVGTAVEGRGYHGRLDAVDDGEELLHPADGHQVQPPIIIEDRHVHPLYTPFLFF